MGSKVENRKLPFLIQKAQSKLINVIKWEKEQVNYLAAFHGMQITNGGHEGQV